MFTGLVQSVVPALTLREDVLELPNPFEGVALGESIAVNGCCLTVVAHDPNLVFELSPETFARTSFRSLRTGQKVNLERALRVGDRLGGHIVQGHVDGLGRVVEIEPSEPYSRMRFEIEAVHAPLLIDKGSIAIDGISLTVVSPEGGVFDVWLIPHTLEHTNLHERRAGDSVNIEMDPIAKHVARLMQPYRP